MCLTVACLDTCIDFETATLSCFGKFYFGSVGTLEIQFYAGVTPLTGFSHHPPPFLFSFLFLLASLFVGVEFWPREPQHLSVGEVWVGANVFFKSVPHSALRARLLLSGWLPVSILPSGASFDT